MFRFLQLTKKLEHYSSIIFTTTIAKLYQQLTNDDRPYFVNKS